MTKTANHMNSYRKEQAMEKEQLIKWLRECSADGSGEHCTECPYFECEDCAGELLKDAAEILDDVSADK